ncbi:MAG: CAP domain-containing protein [Propionicimonas sp.]
MHPFRTVRPRALSVITLALAAGLMCQAPAYADTPTPSPTTAPALSSVTKISPANGLEAGGARVIITGTDFFGVTAVAFGPQPAASFTASSPTSIVAITPALPAGVHTITITNPAGTTLAAKYTVRTLGAEVLRLVNQARRTARTCGSSRYKAVRPLRWDSTLARVATVHSVDMAAHDYFSHYSRGGSSPFQRMKRAGYRYDFAGENIAAGFFSPASVVKAWLKSPGHCRIVMSRRYVELGVGYATGGRYGTYWTQDFGNPR